MKKSIHHFFIFLVDRLSTHKIIRLWYVIFSFFGRFSRFIHLYYHFTRKNSFRTQLNCNFNRENSFRMQLHSIFTEIRFGFNQLKYHFIEKNSFLKRSSFRFIRKKSHRIRFYFIFILKKSVCMYIQLFLFVAEDMQHVLPNKTYIAYPNFHEY